MLISSFASEPETPKQIKIQTTKPTNKNITYFNEQEVPLNKAVIKESDYCKLLENTSEGWYAIQDLRQAS